MDQYDYLYLLFRKIFEVWDTPITLPWIGETSFFKLTVIFSAFRLVGWLIGKLIYGDSGGGDDDDDLDEYRDSDGWVEINSKGRPVK